MKRIENIMKKLLLAFGLLAMTMGVGAQQTPSANQSAKTAQTNSKGKTHLARTVLDEASARFKKSSCVSVGFEIAMNGEVDKGTIMLQGNKFCTKLTNTTTWFDEKNMWSYVHDNEEVNVTEPTSAQVAKINPYAFLELYKKGYSVTYGINTAQYFDIILTATDAKASIKKAIIHIGRHDYRPQYIMMGHSRGDMEIRVTSYKTLSKQPESTFKFSKSKYPNVEVIDLR